MRIFLTDRLPADLLHHADRRRERWPHGVDPGVCLTDVLRRVRIHPAKDIATRTPCPWTEHRGAEPMRPDPFGR